jgi:PhnB protein
MATRKKAKKASRGARARRPARPARRKVQAIPAAYGSLTPALVFRDARLAIDWYGKVFGARVKTRMDMPDGRVMHAELRIGDSILMMGDEAPQMGVRSAESLGGSGSSLMLYVKDCDAVFARAVAEGARALMPPADQFWGDRWGQLIDPFGHRWGIATHTVDLSPRAMQKAAAEAMAQMAAGGPPAAS